MNDAIFHYSQTLITINLQVVILQTETAWVALCPALDLATYGDDEDDVKKAFDDALQIFIEETGKNGTLEKYLLMMGWVLAGGKYIPPPATPTVTITAQFPDARVRNNDAVPVRLPVIAAAA